MSNGSRTSGRQITVMFVAACVAVVLAPVGVMAASHSEVSVGDGKHPSRLAEVTKSGKQVITGSVRSLPSPPFTAMAAGSVDGLDALTVHVPTGPQLVIQTVSATVSYGRSAVAVAGDVQYTAGGNSVHVDFPVPVALANLGYFSATVPLSLYPDPGTTVKFTILSDVSSGPVATGTFAVSGQQT
jgi:hypothetical protein